MDIYTRNAWFKELKEITSPFLLYFQKNKEANKMTKTKWSRKQKTYVAVGVLVGVGFVLGRRYQKKIDLNALKSMVTLTRTATPMFPDIMPISEIKEVLKTVEGAKFADALITTVNGVSELIIRV